MQGALDGVRILDLSRILAGPFASQLLSDLGADVVKVESLDGDDTRGWGPPFIDLDGEEVAAYFVSCNRGKRSIALDLKSESGRRKARALVGAADIILENFRPGTLERLIGDPLAIRSDLIVCSISGFGATGPRRDEPGYDVALQGMSGLMSITGIDGEAPIKVGVAWIDVITGLLASNAIQAAYIHRLRTGQGQRIDLSLWDAAQMALVNQAQNMLVTGSDPIRMGHAHPNLVPYRAFESSDGWLIIAVGSDPQFERLDTLLGTDLIQNPSLRKNAGRVLNRTLVDDTLADVLLTRTRSEWVEALQAIGVPCAPIQTLSEAFQDPQTVARSGVWREDGVEMVSNALRFMDVTPARPKRRPPRLDEHHDEVLREWLEETDIG